MFAWNRSAAPESRPVKLATIHLQPREGKDARRKTDPQFAAVIADAASQGADLIVSCRKR